MKGFDIHQGVNAPSLHGLNSVLAFNLKNKKNVFSSEHRVCQEVFNNNKLLDKKK
jgi:hypothetical protein